MYIWGVVNIALQRASFFGQRQVKYSSPAVFFLLANDSTFQEQYGLSAALFKIKPSDAFFWAKWYGNTFFVRNAAREPKNAL